MSKRRVVVTGMGMLSPVGNSVQSSWRALQAGQSGIVNIEHFDTTNFSTRFAGLIKNFNCEGYVSKKDMRKMDLFIQYGIVAGVQALCDSGLIITDKNASRIGVAIGSGIGGLGLIEAGYKALREKGPRKISPFFVPSTIINMISGYMSIMHGLRGPNIALSTACSTGLHNIGYAARMIAYGDADAIVAGGAEKASTPLGMGGFAAAKALSTRNEEPQKASRPWDKGRDGFVLGDGAGIMVLEEYEHAKVRGARAYCELVGFGMSGDAYHMTSPSEDGSGGALAMEAAMCDAGVIGEQIGYINAHGTSTLVGDIAEVKGIKRALGEIGYKKVLVSSTKSMTGHLLGAAGSVEAIVTVMSLVDQIVPPTINLDNPEENLGIDLVPHTSRKVKMEYAACNSFGFGGTNGCLIFKKI
ncbi:3-oxoacyl synthase 2 [Candidatus Photodesmus blepharus]|uniref:3-oxoacyl-[acyl-carrier-protein] synthase 2 n=1 Tax=Candidatus Photodesmus blepharonis TaxID=1179155 RepID=A0A084CN26_9GAMM|nr:beta-ketoacyl-ACP synthase II [Candidatus Photodesmus blepharus]KEY91205.1 3-oxoacyl synthase 2 [Candidatus Photodesmus blepharus]